MAHARGIPWVIVATIAGIVVSQAMLPRVDNHFQRYWWPLAYALCGAIIGAVIGLAIDGRK